MKLALAKTASVAAALLLALAACSEDAGSNNDGTGDGGEDPVFAAMKTWDACEVLDNLQPITEFMGIEGYGSTTAVGGEPASRAYDTTWYPDAIGCGHLINLGDNVGFVGGGELSVSIIPAESEAAAASLYADRSSAAESAMADDTDPATTEIGDPWVEAILYFSTGTAGSSNLQVIALSEQWVFHIDANYDQDFGLATNGEPAFGFTNDELHQWLIDTYLPAVNQAVNDKIAEVQ